MISNFWIALYSINNGIFGRLWAGKLFISRRQKENSWVSRRTCMAPDKSNKYLAQNSAMVLRLARMILINIFVIKQKI